jgi:hypothetical protein
LARWWESQTHIRDLSSSIETVAIGQGAPAPRI